MSIKVVLFDLDGTLLPMDQDVFAKYYFGMLAARLAPLGYEKESLIKSIWEETAAMVKNRGGRTNEEAFWERFTQIYGEQAREHLPEFEAFYKEDFCKVHASCGYDPSAAKAVKEIKNMGLRVALATNPIFPAIATEKRICWAGLKPEDFELYTTYENSCHCKPNLEYYSDITEKLGVRPEECLMVGNDVGEDMIAERLGMKVYLIPKCIINKESKDISGYPQGDFDSLVEYIKEIV